MPRTEFGRSVVNDAQQIPLRQFESHSRHWRENLYVYPVISRRSGGLSIGINLNPDTACNFDCIYCQVDRTGVPRVRDVDVARLHDELAEMVDLAQSGRIFSDATFADVPPALRRINDIAFSGDGEPTTCREFRTCVELAARLKRTAGLHDAKMVLITDACYLTRPEVEAGLCVMDEHNGEIWAKLDAGTEAYYRLINRPNFPLQHVLYNIVACARIRPIVIQSIFMRVHEEPPPGDELAAYVARLNEILQAGGRIKLVQVYTIARAPAESYVSALTNDEVDAITDAVRTGTGVPAFSYYGQS